VAGVKAIVFDFIGTLISVKDYNMEVSKLKLHKAIAKAGFDADVESFLEAYSRAHEKYRAIRYEELVEVTNAVWISEALNYLGYKIGPEDTRVKVAVNVFFEDYLSSLENNACTNEILVELSKIYKLGLISNFTYAPVIHGALRKLDLNRFFNAILISEDVGWRKPNRKIFEEALRRLRVMAQETIYVGDCPKEDIGGAAATGMKTVFVPSQFYSLETLIESRLKPDLIVNGICELHRTLPRFIEKAT